MTAITLPEQRRELAEVCRMLSAKGLLIGTSGNVSSRFADQVVITPTGAELAGIDADDLCVLTLDGTQIAGALAPTSEVDLHLGCYRELGTGAVVHTHAPKSVAVACAETHLPVFHYQQLLLGGDTHVVPFHPFGTPGLAESTVRALRGKQAALLANHGAVTIGASLGQAADHALLLEWACAIYLDTRRLGGPRLLDDEQQAAVIRAATARGYGATRPAQIDNP
ncbi:class II aldolase/adducin family protein, partial [Nocardia sp. NPDC005745]|uniref:class II aldolase/adducin family protein n=1 Tax=Nocardia sp. NPDC005745 TaxID=3157061 RepID=UPI003403F794